MKRLVCVLSGLLLAASTASAQPPAPGPVGLAQGLQTAYNNLKRNATELVMQGRGQIARGALMANIIAHGNEMYGVSGVYLRAKNIVPPSTERMGGMRGAPGGGQRGGGGRGGQ